MDIIFILVIFFLLIISIIDFLGFLVKGERIVHRILLHITEILSFIVLLFLYITLDTTNNCCGDSTPFSPDHQLTIYTIILLCILAYFYTSFRKTISSPVVEIVVNTFLVVTIVLNVFIALQAEEGIFIIGGNMPIILFTMLALIKNQQLFMLQAEDFSPGNKFESLAWKILHLKPIVKFPVIFLLCLPLLVIITAILLLVGQKPDSLIRAFTDTYKHGFSQLDYQCDNVECGGHYLCSVAANGHKEIVKPQRLGKRNGGTIICNRQLLVSNAFEELVQEKIPWLHKQIRQRYDRVGDVVHRYYGFFNIKIVSDIVYILMKPLEWFFVVVLYTFDTKPENRIARQYLSYNDRLRLRVAESSRTNK